MKVFSSRRSTSRLVSIFICWISETPGVQVLRNIFPDVLRKILLQPWYSSPLPGVWRNFLRICLLRQLLGKRLNYNLVVELASVTVRWGMLLAQWSSVCEMSVVMVLTCNSRLCGWDLLCRLFTHSGDTTKYVLLSGTSTISAIRCWTKFAGKTKLCASKEIFA